MLNRFKIFQKKESYPPGIRKSRVRRKVRGAGGLGRRRETPKRAGLSATFKVLQRIAISPAEA
jgi:hypothetical protein